MLLDRAGAGVSACYGTGGRDLKDEVGAITALDAIARLAADEGTDVILCVSKPPSRWPRRCSRAGRLRDPRGGLHGRRRGGSVVRGPSGRHARGRGARRFGWRASAPAPEDPAGRMGLGRRGQEACSPAARSALKRRRILAGERLGTVHSNAPAGRRLEGAPSGLRGAGSGRGGVHRGRPHPMIDPAAAPSAWPRGGRPRRRSDPPGRRARVRRARRPGIVVPPIREAPALSSPLWATSWAPADPQVRSRQVTPRTPASAWPHQRRRRGSPRRSW